MRNAYHQLTAAERDVVEGALGAVGEMLERRVSVNMAGAPADEVRIAISAWLIDGRERDIREAVRHDERMGRHTP
jgi:hypothetical protein